MANGKNLNAILKRIPADHRFETSQSKQLRVCLKTPILPPK